MDLSIDYELIKKGRPSESIRFLVKQQVPQQSPLPFERPAEDVRQHRAAVQLQELGILSPQLVGQILGDTKLVDELFKFIHALKTGKVKATTNPGGLFLTRVGLREAKLREVVE